MPGGKSQNEINLSEKENDLSKAKSIEDLLDNCPVNKIIGDNLIKAWSKINSDSYEVILCSISGGSDSDIVLDICERVNKNKKIHYIWFNTGLEYQATKEHLKYLEKKYGIEIEEYKAEKPIPVCCKTYGQPFISKQVSEFIQRLQKYNFQWEDDTFENLLNKYCKQIKKEDAYNSKGKLKKGVGEYNGKYYRGCYAALKWWCNQWGAKSKFNINYNKWLKEFMIANPPKYKISNMCCHFAKKLVAKHVKEKMECDLSIVGVRKSEGGARSSAYKNCFSSNCDAPTGCAGCPFGRDFEEELKVIEKYEPKLFVAVNNIFGDSYEYTRKYREFCKMMNEKENKGK